MTDLERDQRLRAALRDADPLRDESPEEEHRALARIRAALDAAAPQPGHGTVAWWRWAVPVATALLLVLLVATSGRLASSPATRVAEHAKSRPAASQETPPPPSAPSGGDSDSRQLQFETPGGTRVIWVLAPNLSL